MKKSPGRGVETRGKKRAKILVTKKGERRENSNEEAQPSGKDAN